MFFIIWLLSFLGIFGIVYGGIRFDLLINPWLKETEFEWIRLVTTHHGITMLYVHDSTLAFLIVGGIAVILGFVIALVFRKT